MLELIQAGEDGLHSARAAVDGSTEPIAVERFLAPITPRRILGTAINYKTHALENPDWVDPGDPMVSWWKGPHAVVGPDDPIVLPSNAVIDRGNWFDTTYEVELLMVIAKDAKFVRSEDADDYIFGYTLINDVTAAGLMLKHAQMMLGKNVDTFAPIGPVIVTKDEFDFENAHISCDVNGVTVQDEPVANMLHRPERLIEWVSSIITIDAGDCISTGTPRGTALWHPDHPWLKPGDVVTVREPSIGQLTNPVSAPQQTL
ncbi:fumarylacetoacetate hydrolase family protein [Kribbella kalugense]|nr:fumarylacetoacetate hydrolase family protein [Kribbella kalugense]